jgi:hypothetical protein
MELYETPAISPRRNDCAGFLLMMMKRRGMREIQAKKESPNLGAAIAVSTPDNTERMKSDFLSFKLQASVWSLALLFLGGEKKNSLPETQLLITK